MKNISPLEDDAMNIFCGYASSQMKFNKKTISNLLGKMRELYEFYEKHKEELFILKSYKSGLDENEKDMITRGYESNCEIINSLKSRVKELSPICPYCLINSSYQCDHYLPKNKTSFPEFSILPINLIPVCWECNNGKSDSAFWDSYRKFINVYFDKIPEERFLYTEIMIKGKTPLITFKVDLSKISWDISKILYSHITELNLCFRYNKISWTIISEIVAQIESLKTRKSFSEDSIIDALNVQKESIWNIYGINYWKYSIYDSIINNKEVCDFLLS